MSRLDPRRLRVAIGLLVVGCVVFAWSMYGYLFGGNAQLEPAEGAFVTLEEDEATSDSGNPEIQSEGSPSEGPTILEDLLAKHGSFDRRTEVRSPFKWILPPAPIVEVKKPAPRPKKGDTDTKAEVKPLPLRVTMTLRAGGIQRAMVDGAVVGIGDRVAAGVVTRIRPDGVEVDTGSGVSFFEIAPASGETDNRGEEK